MESDSGGNNMSLPEELVVQILSRLPVKSLLRFKCVCKSWLSIITHPQLIKTHLYRSTKSPDCHRLLMKTEPSGGFVSFDFENLNHEPKSPQCPFEKDSFLLALCSCDGLILVCVLEKDPDGSFVAELKCTIRMSLILWNPSIGSYKRISCPHEITFSSCFGLGYDSAVDDYRVFIVSRENETSVMVYNSRNDSWNIFIDNRYVRSTWTHQAFDLNGAVHWVMCPYESVSCAIVYFDLVEEKFKEVPPPSSWKKDDEMRLVVLGEQLCVYCDVDVKQIEVYAMIEYGKKESWTRLFVIPCGILKSNQNCNQNCTCTAVRPLCLTKNGQVLIQFGRLGVGNYDPKDSAFLSFDSERGWMPVPYVETLISPGGGVRNLEAKPSKSRLNETREQGMETSKLMEIGSASVNELHQEILISMAK